jgi:magnesium transporter
MKTPKRLKTAGKLGKAGSFKKAGMPPGSLIHVGHVKTERPIIDLIEYDEAGIVEKKDIDVKTAASYLDTPKTTWIKVTGLHNITMIEELGKVFDLHPLVLEDILNTGQRPKLDLFGDHVFLTMKTLSKSDPNAEVNADQLSFILRKNILITFHESDLSIFSSINERLLNKAGRLRLKGPDYLFYALIDVVVDHYFGVIESTGDLIDNIEDELFGLESKEAFMRIQNVKKDLLLLKKHVFPLREAIATIIKIEAELIKPENSKYFKDVYDHLMQIYETIESYRDLNTGLKDMYLSTLSNRMNQVMKTLTIIATIFIPLTFIVGVYGMNFDFMPELSLRYGYFFIWLVMIVIGLGMLIQFKRRKWL